MLLGQSRAASQTLAATASLAKSGARNACEIGAVRVCAVVKVEPRSHTFAVAVSRRAADKPAVPRSVGGVVAALVCGVGASAPSVSASLTPLAAVPPAVT